MHKNNYLIGNLKGCIKIMRCLPKSNQFLFFTLLFISANLYSSNLRLGILLNQPPKFGISVEKNYNGNISKYNSTLANYKKIGIELGYLFYKKKNFEIITNIELTEQCSDYDFKFNSHILQIKPIIFYKIDKWHLGIGAGTGLFYSDFEYDLEYYDSQRHSKSYTGHTSLISSYKSISLNLQYIYLHIGFGFSYEWGWLNGYNDITEYIEDSKYKVSLNSNYNRTVLGIYLIF